jgi:hypothetical protein
MILLSVVNFCHVLRIIYYNYFSSLPCTQLSCNTNSYSPVHIIIGADKRDKVACYKVTGFLLLQNRLPQYLYMNMAGAAT